MKPSTQRSGSLFLAVWRIVKITSRLPQTVSTLSGTRCTANSQRPQEKRALTRSQADSSASPQSNAATRKDISSIKSSLPTATLLLRPRRTAILPGSALLADSLSQTIRHPSIAPPADIPKRILQGLQNKENLLRHKPQEIFRYL